jgi:hypothetical protein
MLEALLGSTVREQVLLYIHSRGCGYSREIARFFESSLDSVQKQLKRLEADSILCSSRSGRTVVYSFNEDHPFHTEIRSLMGRLVELSESGREVESEERRFNRRGSATSERVLVRKSGRKC